MNRRLRGDSLRLSVGGAGTINSITQLNGRVQAGFGFKPQISITNFYIGIPAAHPGHPPGKCLFFLPGGLAIKITRSIAEGSGETGIFESFRATEAELLPGVGGFLAIRQHQRAP